MANDEEREIAALPSTLSAFTQSLIQDYNDLRADKITTAPARVRAQLAREILRSLHLHLQGMRMLADTAKPVPEVAAPDKGRG